jgi:glycosyltransferase involved in cell wall biosynthesis
MNPRVSVVIPVYHRGANIKPTLDSALSQDLPPDEVEIIVDDDGSTDDTFAFLEANYGDNARVRLFSIPNRGVAGARNFGLEQARGEFIAFLDHDDLWLPSKLRLQREALEREPGTVLAYCLWREENEEGQSVGRSTALSPSEWEQMPGGQVFVRLMRHNFLVSASIPLMKCSCVRAVGGFDAAFVPADDWDLWLKLARLGPFVGVNDLLAVYRVHPGQQSKDAHQMFEATQAIRFKTMKSAPLSTLRHPKIFWNAASASCFARTRVPFYDNARGAISRGDWREVRRQMRGCFRRFPLMVLTPQWLYILKRLWTRDARPF